MSIFKDSKNKEWDIIEELSKDNYRLNISPDKILDEDEKIAVKEAMKNKYFKAVQLIKNDYKNMYNVGTVEYTDKHKNYAHHIVHIPDGTHIKEANFAQSKPYTEAIIGKNLHLVGCNLGNVKIDSSWTLEHCLQIQYKYIVKSETAGYDKDNIKKVTVERQIIKKGAVDWEVADEEIYDLSPKVYANFILKIGEQNGD